MKKFINILVVVLALVACADKSGDEAGNGGDAKWVDVTVYAQSGGANTKTLLNDEYDYFWTPSDQIGLFATDNNGGIASVLCIDNLRMTNDQSVAAESTSFSGKLKESDRAKMPKDANYFYAAYYPYKSHIHLSSDFAYYEGFTLPTEQVPSGAKGEGLGAANFPVEYDIMVAPAIADGSIAYLPRPEVALQFEHLFAAVQFTLADDFYKDGAEKVRTITLTAPEGTPLTGGFRVSTTSCEVEFDTNAANYVTLDMSEYGGLGVDETVWALVNPAVIEDDVVLTIETMSGFTYTYAYPVVAYTRGKFNSCEFVIPAFEVSADVYTSYTRYAEGDVAGANALHGSSIYFENVKISGALPATDDKGGRYDVPCTVGIVCNGNYSTRDFADGKAQYTCTAANQWGEYDVQVYARFENGNVVTSACPKVQVTGIPFNYGVSGSDNGAGTGFNASEGEGAMSDVNFPWEKTNITQTDVAITTSPTEESYVVSPSFYVPSTAANVKVAVRGWWSTSVAVGSNGSTLQVGPVGSFGAPMLKVNAEITSNSTSLSGSAYQEFEAFNLSPTLNRVCIYDDDDSDSALFWNWPYFYLFKVAVSYAQ